MRKIRPKECCCSGLWLARMGAFMVLSLAAHATTSCSADVPTFPADRPRESVAETLSGPGSPDLGTLLGRVLFEGKPVPRSTRVLNTTDPHECGEVQSLDNVLISSDGGLANAVIRVLGVPLAAGLQVPASRLVLDNRDCRFSPRVSVLTAGSVLETTNSDAVTHTVHVYGLFNLNVALGPSQSKLVRRLERPGWYTVRCDLHGWMQATLRVDEHPFHAVSSGRGDFEIRDLPAGVYQMETWHEFFGRKEQEIRVRRGETTTATVRYPKPPHKR